MSGGYLLIAGILLYVFLVQRAGSSGINPVKGAVIFVVGYHALQSIVMGILYYAREVPILPNILSVTIVVTAILQFVTAVFIFYKADESADDYMSYALWGGLGLAALFFVIPMTTQSLLRGL